MQLYALTRENTRRTLDHYWNLQKLSSLDELPQVGKSLDTANWTLPCAMDAFDTLNEDGDMKLDLTQPYQIVVQADGMERFVMTCDSDWAITVLMFD